MNQNRSISSSPSPLKVGNLICAAIPSTGGGGGGVGGFSPLHEFDGGVVKGIVYVFAAPPFFRSGRSLRGMYTDLSFY